MPTPEGTRAQQANNTIKAMDTASKRMGYKVWLIAMPAFLAVTALLVWAGR